MKINTAAHWGAIEVEIQQGVAASSKGLLSSVIENELQTVVPDQIYSDRRVKAPMVRKGFLEGNVDTRLRGQDDWVQVSWKDALDLVHHKITQVRQAVGSQGIFAGSYGWYSCGVLHSCRSLLLRYMNLTGGAVDIVGDYSTGAAQVILPHVIGSSQVYEPQTSWESILTHSDIVVLWGANPLTTLRVAWVATDQKGIDYLAKLKASGKRIICIDPIRSESCDYLQAEWLPINPNTDVALILGIAHTLIINDLHDKAFLAKYTVGFDTFCAYVLGETDNQPKTAEWASQICGISAKQIATLATHFAQYRTMLMGGWAMQRQPFGEQAPWALVSLAAMLGQIGLAGGGFGMNYHCNGGVPVCNAAAMKGINAYPDPTVPKWQIPVARIADCLLNPHKPYSFNGKTHHYPNIQLIYWAGGNPFVHHQDTNRLRQAWQQAQTVIVNECYWTPTAKMADIVLPATTSFERNDLTMSGSYSQSHIFPMKQIVEPQFEAKNDYDIFAELAQRAGRFAEFTEGKTEMEWLAEIYHTARQQAVNKHPNIAMPDFATFWQQNQPMAFMPTEESTTWVKFADFRQNPTAYPLATPSGKIEICSETIANMQYLNCPKHPTWLGKSPLTAELPLRLITPHPYFRLHSQLAYTRLREKYAVNGREPILIHPHDAKVRGIQAGDIVRIANQNGQVLAGAVITINIIAGTVAMYEGGWYDPDFNDMQNENPLCLNGNPNVLTADIGSSHLSQATAPNGCPVEIERYVASKK